MSVRWGGSKRDRDALDQWITRDTWGEEYDPPCPKCGAPASDHEPIQVTGVDSMSGEFDYETYQCPQPETGSTMARDNDPAFEEVAIPGYSVVVDEPRYCNFCKVIHEQIIGLVGTTVAKYDGKTKMGPWADMCQEHFDEFGVGLGLGRGQKLISKKL